MAREVFGSKKWRKLGLAQLELIRHGGWYDSELLRTLIETNFNNYSAHPNPTPTFCVAVNKDHLNETWLFSNYRAPNAPTEDSDAPVQNRTQTHMQKSGAPECLRATSAAPTYFRPGYVFGNNRSFLDGGLGVNNPVFEAQAELQRMYPNHSLEIISIGTGMKRDFAHPHKFEHHAASAGLLTLFSQFVSLMTQTERIHEYFQNNVGSRDIVYHRLNVEETHEGYPLGNIGLDEYRDEPLRMMEEATTDYVGQKSNLFVHIATTLLN